MQQPQRGLEQIDQIRTCNSRRSRVRAFLEVQPRLDQLDVPVAELGPEEIVDAIGCLIETVCLQRLVHVLRRAIEARKNPPVFEGLRVEPRNATRLRGRVARAHTSGTQAWLHSIHVHEHEARRIPYLVGKIPIPRRAALAEGDIGARRRHRRQSEARRVRPVLPDHLDRIEYVPFHLRHLLPIRIAHQCVDVDLSKGNARTQRIFIRIGAPGSRPFFGR